MTVRPLMRLRLLGRFAITDDLGGPIQLPTRKTAALLAFLGMSRDYAASREELAGLLWGDCSEQQARQSLRQALALLRKQFDPSCLVTSEANLVRLDRARWSIDARDFETLAHSSRAEDLSRAAELFAGDFLAGFHLDEEAFEEWVREQRTRMQLAAAHLSETFAGRPDLVANSNLALAAVEQLTSLDTLREDWHRLAIVLYARYRGKNEALARANRFADMLMRELGVGPEKETRALLEAIRGGDAAASPLMPPADKATHLSAPSSGNVGTNPPDAAPGSAIAMIPPDTARRSLFPLSPNAKTIAALALAPCLFAGGLIGLQIVLRPAVPPAPSIIASSQADPWRSPSSPPEARLSKAITPIVVLPFTSLNGSDDSSQLTADMLTDDLTNILSHVPSFRVISGQTARRYQGQPVDVAKLESELQVRYVLEGSVRISDNHLRVNVQLINPATRLAVWSDRVERNGADRQGIRDEIVNRLARELQFGVLPIESVRLSADLDSDALAYKGWAALSRVNLTGYARALEFFKEALQRDPQNLSARIGLGAYHAKMGAQVFDTDPLGHRARAEKILRQALTREPNSSQAHYFLALALNKLPTLPEAIEHLQRAITIEPSNASAHAQIGNGLIRTGRPAEGLEHVRYAMRLSPLDPVMPIWLEFAGNAELELNNYPEAIRLFQRSIALNPGYPRSWAGLVAADALAGDFEKARRCAEKLRTFTPSLSNEALTRQFGRHDGSKLREGLQLAFAIQPER